jgi:hypothetical protein
MSPFVAKAKLPDRADGIHATLAGERGLNQGCGSSHGRACEFSDLHAGDTVSVSVHAHDCAEVERSVQLHARDNEETFPCRPLPPR